MRIAKALRHSAWLPLSLLLIAGTSTAVAQTADAIVVATQTLEFSHQIGTTAPPAQAVRVFTAPANVDFTATAASTGGWLLVNGNLTATGRSGTATQDIMVSVNPGAITQPANLTGTVTLASGTTSIAIAVSLSVSASTQIRLDPNALNVSVPAGTSSTYTINVVGTNAAGITYTATANNVETIPSTNWLTVSPSFGTTGQNNAIVTINTAAIEAGRGLAVGVIRFQAFPGGGKVSVPVTVQIGAAAEVLVSPTTVTFPYQIGFGAPSTRTVSVVSSSTTQLPYTATIVSAQNNWLSISASAAGTPTTVVQNTTPNPLYLIPNIAAVGSTAGTYNASIRIDGPAGTASKTITARLVVTSTPQLTVFQDPQPFLYTLGAVLPAAQNVTVNSTSTALSFTVSKVFAAETGGEWFNVIPLLGTTPAALQISVDATRLQALAAGTYTGAVRLTSGATTLDIPVSLTVSGSALITVEGGPIDFNAQLGQTPPSRTLIVRSTDNSSQQFTVSVDPSTASWLIVSPTSGNTGSTGSVLSVNVNPGAISTAGTYQASIVVTPTSVTNAVPFRVPVTYVATGNTLVTAAPTSLTATQNGTTVPAPQTIQVSSATNGLQFTVSSAQSWIRVSPASAFTPSTITVTYDSANLTPGTYNGSVVITVSGVQTVNVPVTLTVNSAASLNHTPASLTFAYTQGAANPTAQTINLSSSGAALAFTATATSTGNWLSVTPASGTTNIQGGAVTPLGVSVNPAGLTPGTYQGSVTISAPTATNTTTTVNVTLTVTAPSLPTNLTVTHSSTGIAGPVSPGLVVTIKGRNMAPATAMTSRIVNNVVQTTLGDVRVTFDGIEAPLLYVGPSGDGNGDQINAIVPYGIGNRVQSRLVVEYRNNRSEAVDVRVAETAPGIYTQNQSGSGLGAILNANSTVNGPNNAAERGSIIQIFATGEGAVVPAGNDGRVIQTAAELRQPLGRVTVRINGIEADVTYAGSAPTLVSGVFQVNARIPQNLGVVGSSQVPVEVQVGSNISQRGVTVAVR